MLDKKYKPNYGMVKIVPPSSWKPSKATIQPKLNELIIKHPIQQNIQGNGGYYQSRNYTQDRMDFLSYKKYALESEKTVSGKNAPERQKLFWKTLTYSPPLYGSDLTGSLMDNQAAEWNMNTLNSLLASAVTTKIKGINEPYCYIGAWKTIFCWHREDLDLSAINYLHFGQPKMWYAIETKDGAILDAEAKKAFPSIYQKCKEFMRHKTILIDPYVLRKKYPEIKINKAEQKQNQFMIVFGGAYHTGFNCGFNVAEAVNYATKDWLKQMQLAGTCKCSHSSVRISELEIITNLSKSEWAQDEQFKMFNSNIQKKYNLNEQMNVLKQQIKCKLMDKIKIIKKNRRNKNKQKNKIQGNEIKLEQYDMNFNIQNYIQCEKCLIWRILDKPLKNQSTAGFQCALIGKICHKLYPQEQQLKNQDIDLE